MGIETATLRLRYALIYLLPDIKSNERTEYSYIGLAVFFSGKSLKVCSLSSVHFYC